MVHVVAFALVHLCWSRSSFSDPVRLFAVTGAAAVPEREQGWNVQRAVFLLQQGYGPGEFLHTQPASTGLARCEFLHISVPVNDKDKLYLLDWLA